MTPAPTPTLTLIVAVARNGVIGRDSDMPWHLPDELRYFKETTLGHTLLMGRATYDAIGRPLPGRRTIVLTRDRDWQRDGVEVVHTLEDAVALSRDAGETELFVAGGAQVYAATLPHADVLLLTEVHAEPEGDTFFPEWDRSEWVETDRSDHDGWSRVRLERTSGRTNLC